MLTFLRAPKRLSFRGLKKRKAKTINLRLTHIDTTPIPTGGSKAIADRENEYLEIYSDPYLSKMK